MVVKIKIFFFTFWYFFLLLVFVSKKNKKMILLDIERWSKQYYYSSNIYFQLVYLLKFCPSFRNIFYFRCSNIPNIIQNIFCRPDPNFYIADYIPNTFNCIEGGGIFVVHSFGTRI